jgi:hypothetical protein
VYDEPGMVEREQKLFHACLVLTLFSKKIREPFFHLAHERRATKALFRMGTNGICKTIWVATEQVCEPAYISSTHSVLSPLDFAF